MPRQIGNDHLRLNEFVPTKPPLIVRQLFTGSVEDRVLFLAGCHELFVRFAGTPEIESEVSPRTKRIPHQPRLIAVGVALEQPYPVTVRAVGVLESFFTTRLDFLLPQRYKHRGPISCSLDIRVSASKL